MKSRSEYSPWQAFDLVQAAARTAALVHRSDVRSGTSIPHLARLWSVASLVIEHGGDDVQVAASLLRDVPAEVTTENALQRRFGAEVLDLVEAIGAGSVDGLAFDGSATVSAARRAFLDRFASTDERARLVLACSALYDGRTELSRLRTAGPVCELVTGRGERVGFWSRVVDLVVRSAVPRDLATELAAVVSSMMDLEARGS